MTDPKPRTGLARYVHDVVDATAECLNEVRGCLEDLLEHADGLQGSARSTVRCVVRPGTAAVDQIGELRAAVAALSERLAQLAGDRSNGAEPA